MTRRWQVLFLCLLVSACAYRKRGDVALLAIDPRELPVELVVLEHVDGKACFDEHDEDVIAAATRAALAKVPGADAIAAAWVIDNGPCVVVRGVAVELKPKATRPPVTGGNP